MRVEQYLHGTVHQNKDRQMCMQELDQEGVDHSIDRVAGQKM
jgi:hypothetical protein